MQQSLSVTWDSLYAELLTFVQRKIKDRHTAEDIVQDVFIKVHTKSAQLKHEDKIVGWIFQITRNAVADYFRNNSKHDRDVDIDWDSSFHEFNECVSQCLKKLMHELPDMYRVPLELAEISGHSQFQIADKLNISYSGARSRIQRARRMLKEKLDDLYYIKTDRYGNIIACEDKVPCCCQKKC